MKLLSDRDELYITLINKLKMSSYTYDELLEELAISRNNLTKLITDINDIVNSKIITTNKALINLTFNNWISYDYCISEILKNSLEYNLLEYIFFSEDSSYLTLSLDLFVSESTIRKVIAQLNSKLKTVNCEILTRPIRMSGDERNVRMLYFRLFKEKYGLSNTPFKDDEKKYIDQFYKINIPFIHRNKSMQEQLNFQLLSLIALYREKQNHSISSVRKIGVAVPAAIKVSNFLSNFSVFGIRKIPNSMSVEFVSKVFSVFLSNEFLDHTNYNKLDSKKNDKFNSVINFVDDIENLFNIPINKEERLKLCRDLYDGIYGYLSIDKSLVDLIIINNEYENFLDEADYLVKDIIPIIENIYNHHIEESKHSYFSFAFYVLQTRFNYAFIKEISNKLNVTTYIYIDYDYYFSEYIKTRIEFEIGNHINIKLLKTFDEVQEKLDNTDLIVTNLIHDSLSTDNVIRISNYLSKENIVEIADWLRNKKRQVLNEVIVKSN